MRIGIDTSGKFTTDMTQLQPTVVTAAVGPDHAFDEIATWSREALKRWGYAGSVAELHAKNLKLDETHEVCTMLASRGDIRLAAIVTDPLMLKSPEAIACHRRRQHEQAESMKPRTKQGKDLKEAMLALLDGRALKDYEYLLSACLPVVLMAAAQRAIAFFADDASRPDMERFVVRIDEETAPTVRYGGGALFPSLSGDDRFGLITPRHWADDPAHPLLSRIFDPSDGQICLARLFDDLDWVSSDTETAIQIADIAAWVLARRIKKPGEAKAAACFEPLAPLFSGEGGRNFEFFSIGDIRPDQLAMYSHLQQGTEPVWWLRLAAPPLDGPFAKRGPST